MYPEQFVRSIKLVLTNNSVQIIANNLTAGPKSIANPN